MILSQKNKISNFCEPCKNRGRNKEGKLICSLTNNTPKISNTCRKHTYDPNLEIVLKKHLLEKGYKQNTLTDLLDPEYNESIETIHPSSKKIFNYSLTSRSFTFVLYTSFIALAIWLLINQQSYNALTLFYIALIIVFIIPLRNSFKYKKELAVDIDGVSFESNQFLWEFIAGMYLYQELEEGDNSDEEYLILLHHSGKEFKLDTSHISFSEWQLKRVINSYRHYGYNNKKSNYITI